MPTVAATQLSEPGPPDAPKPLLVLGSSLGVAVETLWARVVPGVADRFHVVGWDLPGHGRSPVPTEGFTVAELADAVVDLVRRVRPGGGPAYYAGVSLGGATGLQVAVDHPGTFAGTLMVCSAAALGEPQAWHDRAATVRSQGTAVLVEGSAARWFAPGFLDREPQTASRLLHELSHDVSDEGYAACCEALAAYDLTGRLDEVRDPLVVLNGGDDQVAPPSAAQVIADAVPDARAVVLDGVAHQAPVEDPAGTTRTLLDAFAGGAVAQDSYDAGMAVRREVLGDAHVDRAVARTDDLTRDFQELITRYAWGSVWTRPGLDRVTRSAITITALVAGHHHDELAMHVRAAMRNGMTREQLSEVLLQSAIYCSVPSANTAFQIAQRTLAQIDEEEVR
ncbi:hypothetical protein ADJ73_06015 [Arsenicicoccus sp. oral taxon 190]|nr:hypothetical protein ADJ73_06015 [Arsenicicoccus sp. oral taxon 190]